MTPFLSLPCYAVGEATARAAREAGFADVRTGPADGAALLELMADDGIAAAFHPCGEDRTELPTPQFRLLSVPVYAAEAADRLPDAAATALEAGAIALVHSTRAGALLARLAADRRGAVAIAAISPAAAAAAGPGWKSVSVSSRPRDEALLELVAKLCQNGAG